MLGIEYIAFGIAKQATLYELADGCPKNLALVKACDDALNKISLTKNALLVTLEKEKTE